MTNSIQNSPIDLEAVFRSDAAAATRERVIRYIGRYFDECSNRPAAQRENPLLTVEEFDLLMPTERAWFDELRVCQAILDHAAGRVSDLEIKAVLDAYVESHVYVYRGGVRTVKAGDWERWADCPLVYVTAPKHPEIAFTCNEVQAWFVRLLNEGTTFIVRRV